MRKHPRKSGLRSGKFPSDGIQNTEKKISDVTQNVTKDSENSKYDLGLISLAKNAKIFKELELLLLTKN